MTTFNYGKHVHTLVFAISKYFWSVFLSVKRVACAKVSNATIAIIDGRDVTTSNASRSTSVEYK